MKSSTDRSTDGDMKTGYYFGDIADIHSPVEAIKAAIACIGTVFGCDRVYIFKKNQEGNYDCTDEWCREGTLPKQDLMQNLSPKTVSYYYRYFQKQGQLSLNDIDMLRESDTDLYKLLKYQELRSTFVTQLLYNEEDLGFIGLDNPAQEKFHELDPIMRIIKYYLAIQVHHADMDRKLMQSRELALGEETSNRSIYNRVSELVNGDSFGLIEIQLDLPEQAESSDACRRLSGHVNRILDSIFKSNNVYSLGANEFLIIYESRDEKSMDQHIEAAQQALASLNIHAVAGSVIEPDYQGNFFELVTKTNEKILQEKRRYKEMQLSKYHMPSRENGFTGLFEVRVEQSAYRVLYSETLTYPSLEGDVEDLQSYLEQDVIFEEDKKLFRDFWEKAFRHTGDAQTDVIKQNLRIHRGNDVVEMISCNATAYHDVENHRVILCSTY